MSPVLLVTSKLQPIARFIYIFRQYYVVLTTVGHDGKEIMSTSATFNTPSSKKFGEPVRSQSSVRSKSVPGALIPEYPKGEGIGERACFVPLLLPTHSVSQAIIFLAFLWFLFSATLYIACLSLSEVVTKPSFLNFLLHPAHYLSYSKAAKQNIAIGNYYQELYLFSLSNKILCPN